MNKVCTKCGKNKPLEDYYVSNKEKNYRRSECKSCTIVATNKYNKTNKGKLIHNKSQTRYSKSGKGILTDVKSSRKYQKSDKGKAMIARRNHTRRANIANSINTLDDKQFSCILFLQKYQCSCCGEYFDKVGPQRDHIKPVSDGGDFTKENIQALCGSCNSRKGVQTIDYRTEQHIKCICLGGSEI